VGRPGSFLRVVTIVTIHIQFLFGVGMLHEGLIDRILQIVFLLPLEKVEEGFVLADSVSVLVC
jgi:hypothetical protein